MFPTQEHPNTPSKFRQQTLRYNTPVNFVRFTSIFSF